jgi:hypothetical protein
MYNDRNEKSEMITKGVACSPPVCPCETSHQFARRCGWSIIYHLLVSLSFSSCVSVPISSLTVPQVQGVGVVKSLVALATCSQKQASGD